MFRRFLFPLYETPGDGGGGGTPAPGSGGMPSGGASPISFSDDTEFIPPGSDKPVKWKDFSSSYVPKSEFTRRTQELARERETWQQQRTREEAQLRQTAQQLAARLQAPANGNQVDPFAEIAAAPYIDGKTAAALMRQIVTGVNGRFQQYEQAIGLLTQRLQKAEQGYSSLSTTNRRSQQTALYDGALKAAGLPDNEHTRGLLEEQYFAHEGWNTVSHEEAVAELARLAKGRYDGIIGAQRAADQAKVDQYRNQNRTPSLPALKRKPGRVPGSETPAELADQLWPLVQGPPNA